MHKTLLLCFIHGFKGGDDTFGGFPEHLRALVSHALPNISVSAVTYPRFETRGDLKECVGRFREWWVAAKFLESLLDWSRKAKHQGEYRLQNVVIDLEVAAGTPSPTVDPSVRTILIGHSMGGIVAVDALLSITEESPIPGKSSSNDNDHPQSRSSTPPPSPFAFMFPYVQGVLAFDTPYLGISPGVVAYGAETHYKTASSAYSSISEVAGLFGFGAAASTAASQKPTQRRAITAGPAAAKEAMAAASMTANSADAAAVPAWSRWGKYAMFAGAAGAVAAGGAAAYLKRDTITEGWSWVGSHLEFIGCLMRGEELKSRMKQMSTLRNEKAIGFADLHTVLGQAGEVQGTTVAGGFVEIGAKDAGRTFCVIPKSPEWKTIFEGMVNDKATDETLAHMSMFYPRDNPGYYGMSERAKDLLVNWVDQAWYEDSDGKEMMGENLGEPEFLSGEKPVMVD